MNATAVDLELEEIQGNILAGFNKPYASFLFFALPNDRSKAKTWLGELVSQVATTRQVAEYNDRFRASREDGTERPEPVWWMNVAFTSQGLAALGVEPADLERLPADFREGMRARAARIGDIGKNAPESWPTPFKPGVAVISALMIVAADLPETRNGQVAKFVDHATQFDVQLAFQQPAMSRTDLPGREHFGFKDAVSQPRVAGLKNDLPDGTELVEAGEFILGYPREQRRSESSPPTSDPTDVHPTWLRNGSFLVFRRLTQDVAGFEAFVRYSARRLGMSEELFRAKLMGRYRSGAPLAVAQDDPNDPGAAALSRDEINNFGYASDPFGSVVPRGAHIRKAFPRDQVPPGEVEARAHRIMRRGVPFGATYSPSAKENTPYGDAEFPDDRGLCFVCYQSSIAEQFEHIQRAWLNDQDYPEPGDGIDPVASQKNRFLSLSVPQDPRRRIDLARDWVQTTGGEYFFSPSIRALTQFAT